METEDVRFLGSSSYRFLHALGFSLSIIPPTAVPFVFSLLTVAS